jgi:hypothetical protein
MQAPGTGTSWIQSSFELHGRRVSVSVRRLPDDERRRVAAQVAWFADAVLHGAKPSAAEWPAFFQDILTNDVTITVEEDGIDAITGFWDHALCRIFQTYLRANQLDPAICLNMGQHGTRFQI